jgi:hypothetical protein
MLVLRPGGQIAVSDSDYNILTMAISSADPLQSCARALVATDVNDLGSRAGAAMLAPAGFTRPQLRRHGYVQAADTAYLLSAASRRPDAGRKPPGAP